MEYKGETTEEVVEKLAQEEPELNLEFFLITINKYSARRLKKWILRTNFNKNLILYLSISLVSTLIYPQLCIYGKLDDLYLWLQRRNN